MGYAALLQELAGTPHGIVAVTLSEDVLAAEAAGLVKIRPHWDVDRITLTEAGRRTLGLPPLRQPALNRWLGKND